MRPKTETKSGWAPTSSSRSFILRFLRVNSPSWTLTSVPMSAVVTRVSQARKSSPSWGSVEPMRASSGSGTYRPEHQSRSRATQVRLGSARAGSSGLVMTTSVTEPAKVMTRMRPSRMTERAGGWAMSQAWTRVL